MHKSQTAKIVSRVLFWILVAFIFIEMVFPFYWAINSSFKSDSQLSMTPATMVPRSTTEPHRFAPTLENYSTVLRDPTFWLGISNSAIVAISVTILSLAIGSFAAFALGKLRFKGKGAVKYLVLSMTMFPQIAVLTGLYAVKRSLGIPAIPGMILSYLLFTLPFTTWIMTSFFEGLPTSLLESARVDGANVFQSFYRILLPLTAPAAVTTGLLAFILSWNEYLFALTFTTIEREARTVPVVIALFSGSVAHQDPFGQIMAAAVLVTIPLIVLVLIFQRKIVQGLTAGAVKG